MKISPDHKTINVESQLNDPKSVRSYWKKMIQLRKKEEGLVSDTTLGILQTDRSESVE